MKQFLSLIACSESGGLSSDIPRILSRLSRTRLASLVALSALSGFLFAAQGFSGQAVLVFMAIWLLAAGCSALNQLQEIQIDSRMQRTRTRPLPAGELSTTGALLISATLLSGGLGLLQTTGEAPLLLGLLAILWYNGIYTPLKKKTAWAVFPGAVCGALPPLIGYSAAGGSILDSAALILAGTLLIWQVPHFWLLAWRYPQDQLDSGLPSPFRLLNERCLFAINSYWLAALVLCYLLFPLFGMIAHPSLTYLYLALLSGLLLAGSHALLRGPQDLGSGRLFHLLNLSMALLLLTLICDNLG